MEEAGGKELTNQRGTTTLWWAWAKHGPLFPFVLLLHLDHCLTRSIHSGRKGKVLKVSLMYFTTLCRDVAVVMVIFFKTSNWDFHPHSTLERNSKEEEVCIQKHLMSAGLSLLLSWYTYCSGEHISYAFQVFLTNALGSGNAGLGG